MDRTLKSRYECKYLVHKDMVPLVRRYLTPFVRPDRYTATADDQGYRICSLYLDTPDLNLYHGTVEGHKSRFKLRMRTYSDHPDSPVYVEIKRRNDRVVQKTRACVDRVSAKRYLAGHSVLESISDEATASAFEEFSALVRRFNARPIARVRYSREAYEATGFEPVRITFDTNLSHAAARDGDLSHNGQGWQSNDPGGVVLEVKFTGRLPAWIVQMVRRFELQKQSVPKYVMAVDKMLDRDSPKHPIIIIPRRSTIMRSGGA